MFNAARPGRTKRPPCDYAPLLYVAIWAIAILPGCATERSVSPALPGAPRSGLTVVQPLYSGVFDSRPRQESQDTADLLKADLDYLYGPAIEWADYFNKTQPGQVSARIRIVALGSSLDNRLISPSAYMAALNAARKEAAGPWSAVVASVAAERLVVPSSLSGEEWWNGTAWIDLEVEDLRDTKPIIFTLPILAEHQEPNMLGIVSGDSAARTAWKRAGAQLTKALDIVLRILQNQQCN